MKTFVQLAFSAVLPLLLTSVALAQNTDFPGVQKAMSPEAYGAAGLNKLSPDERARLDEFIRGYASTSAEKAATAAVDQATRSGKVKRNEPEVIESSIVGRFSGYDGRTTFTLENGQVYKQSQPVSRNYPPVDSPPVIVTKGTGTFSGYRMYILGGGNIRVGRLK